MSRTYSSDDLITVAMKLGWNPSRQKGSHMTLVKAGEPRPIVVQVNQKEIANFIVANISRQLGIKKSELVDYL